MFLLCILILFSLSYPQVIARVDDRIITLEEFNTAFKDYWKNVVHINGRKPTVEDKKVFLFEFIKGILIEKVSASMGLRVSDEEIQRRLRLWGVGKASEIVLEMVKREILLEKLVDRVAGDVRVGDEEIRAYYLLNKREFFYPKQIKLLRVIAKDRRSAKKAYMYLREGKIPQGENIIVGKERWYSVEALPRRIRVRLYPYKVGKVSKPIDLETGYLILKITDKRKSGFLPFQEVKERVKAKLLREKKEEVMKRWFRDLLRYHSLVIYLQRLE